MDNCAICQSSTNIFLTTTQCNHNFHKVCLDNYSKFCIKYNKSLKCPLCRNLLQPYKRNIIQPKINNDFSIEYFENGKKKYFDLLKLK